MKPVKREGSDAVKAIVQKVVGERPDLAICEIAIIESSRMPPGTPVKTIKAGPLAEIMNFDLTLVYSGPVFMSLEDDKIEALIANSLADWKGVAKESRDNAQTYVDYKRNNALRIHPVVLAKYGANLPEHCEMIDTMSQLKLDFGVDDLPPQEEKPSTVRKRKKVVALK